MRILVDADACPVRALIVKEAKRRRIPIVMLSDTCHEVADGYSEVITVDKGRDSADIRLANLTCRGDLVVTQDYGVAALALGRGAKAMNQNGMEYTAGNMDRLLFERALGQRVRRAGGKVGKTKKRTAADDEQFLLRFCALLNGEKEEFD